MTATDFFTTKFGHSPNSDKDKLIVAMMAEYAEQHKQVIKDLLKVYVFNLDDNGDLNASVTEIIHLIDKAHKLVDNV